MVLTRKGTDTRFPGLIDAIRESEQMQGQAAEERSHGVFYRGSLDSINNVANDMSLPMDLGSSDTNLTTGQEGMGGSTTAAGPALTQKYTVDNNLKRHSPKEDLYEAFACNSYILKISNDLDATDRIDTVYNPLIGTINRPTGPRIILDGAISMKSSWKYLPNRNIWNYIKFGQFSKFIEKGCNAFKVNSLKIVIKNVYQTSQYAFSQQALLQYDAAHLFIKRGSNIVGNQYIVGEQDPYRNANRVVSFYDKQFPVHNLDTVSDYKIATTGANSIAYTVPNLTANTLNDVATYNIPFKDWKYTDADTIISGINYTPGLRSDLMIDIDRVEPYEVVGSGYQWEWEWHNPNKNWQSMLNSVDPTFRCQYNATVGTNTNTFNQQDKFLNELIIENTVDSLSEVCDDYYQNATGGTNYYAKRLNGNIKKKDKLIEPILLKVPYYTVPVGTPQVVDFYLTVEYHIDISFKNINHDTEYRYSSMRNTLPSINQANIIRWRDINAGSTQCLTDYKRTNLWDTNHNIDRHYENRYNAENTLVDRGIGIRPPRTTTGIPPGNIASTIADNINTAGNDITTNTVKSSAAGLNLF